MSQFKDSVGDVWILDIKVADVERVRKLVKDKEGLPIDLLVITEQGGFKQLKNIETTLNIIQVLCLEQIGQRFDLTKYDAENESIYEAIPEWRDESVMQKKSRWLASRINFEVLPAMMEALFEALINFTSSPSRRDAMRSIHDGERELEEISCRETVKNMAEATKRGQEIIMRTMEKAVEKMPEMFQQKMDETLSEKFEGGKKSENAPLS